MPLDGTNELPQIWASMLAYELRNDSVASRISSTAYTEAWASGAATQVRIPLPDFAYTAGTTAGTATDPNDSTGINTVATTTARPSWPAMTTPDVGAANFTRDGTLANSMLINEYDATYAAWPVVETHRSRKAYEIMNQYDKAVIDHIDGVDTSPTTYGNTTNYLSPTGTPATNTARTYTMDILKDFRRQCKVNGWKEDASRGIGMPYAIWHPNTFNALLNELERLDFNLDEITRAAVVSNSVMGTTAFEGVFYGIALFTSLNMPVAEDNAGANNNVPHKVFCGVPNAVAANVRPIAAQFKTPEDNQVTTDIGYLLRQAVDYGISTVYSAGVIEYNIPSGGTT